MQETWVQFLGQEDPLEKGMAIHSCILAWRIPWTEEPGELQSIASQGVEHNWATFTHTHTNTEFFLSLAFISHNTSVQWNRCHMCASPKEDWEKQKSKSSAAAAAAKSLQSCPTLCDPKDDRPPGSPVPGILQARVLEWVAISFSNAGKWKVKVKSLSRVRLLVTPWTAAHQAPPSMGFSRQEYWSGLPRLLWSKSSSHNQFFLNKEQNKN